MSRSTKQQKTLVVVKSEQPWDLVVATNSPMTDNDLPLLVQNEICVQVWRRQDGFGSTGLTPPQGWDWSGIRDSSPFAKRRMAAAVRRVLRSHFITSFRKWSAI